MIRRVYESAVATGVFDAVVVATDDRRILEAVRSFGGDARMTRAEHPSGTDRVAEIAASEEAPIVVNVQGDLPFFSRSLVEPLVTAMRADASIPMATVSVPILDREAFESPNVVKVVTDERGFALYFSRAPIPARRGDSPPNGKPRVYGRQHVGVYGYRRDFLLRFTRWEMSELERSEQLEQLRALERGVRIFVAEASATVVEVDTAEDLERARELAARERPLG
jgi:3-deoxy-manno-octulosonate cytidylyltransferase (CMP-KDO synthetase)